MTFDSLCFQALAWTTDGELDPLDKLVLLDNLIRQAHTKRADRVD